MRYGYEPLCICLSVMIGVVLLVSRSCSKHFVIHQAGWVVSLLDTIVTYRYINVRACHSYYLTQYPYASTNMPFLYSFYAFGSTAYYFVYIIRNALGLML